MLGKWRNVPLLCPRCDKPVNCHDKDLLENLECEDCYNWLSNSDDCTLDNQDDRLGEKDVCKCTIHELRMLAVELRLENDSLFYQLMIKRYKDG